MRFIFSILLLFICIFKHSAQLTDTNLIVKHLTEITKTKGYRHLMNVDLLNKTANYISNDFKKYADTVYFQEYTVVTCNSGPIFNHIRT